MLANPDPAQVLRFNLFLAVLLCHELAHFFETAHNFPQRREEVYMNDNNWAESGGAFECKVFGGVLHPICARIDCAYGLATYNWPPRSANDKEDTIMYTVPMEFVAKLQQQDMWDELEKLEPMDPKTLLIPRTGARSVGLLALDMSMWDDEADVQVLDDVLGDLTGVEWKRMFDGGIVRGQPGQLKSHLREETNLKKTVSGRIGKRDPKLAKAESQLHRSPLATRKKVVTGRLGRTKKRTHFNLPRRYIVKPSRFNGRKAAHRRDLKHQHRRRQIITRFKSDE